MRRLVVLCTLLTTILVASQGVVRTMGHLTYRDPFARYRAIMPGQLSSVLKAYSCPSYVAAGLGAETGYCQFTPQGGQDPFSSITIVYHSMIERLGFSVRPGYLHLGDLLECWGRPSYVGAEDASTAEMGLLDIAWGKQLYAVVDTIQSHYRGRLDYALPISYVQIEGSGASCDSS